MGETMKRGREQDSLINELIQGKELAKLLCNHLVSSSTSSSNETNELLIAKILSSYEKILTMLNWGSNVGESYYSHCSVIDGSPRSVVLDQEFKRKSVFKKRKTVPRWTEQVKVVSGRGVEGSWDDGYGWRKYGQKDILGAKFPRGYYRCTHRNLQGCLATKQVQRSDEDPTIFEVTYRGRHTCTQAKHLNKAFPSKIKMGLVESQPHNDQENQPKQEKMEQPSQAIFTFEAEHEAKTENIDPKEEIFPWFSFPSPSIESENDDNMLSETILENHFTGSFPTSFISPAISESDMFCLSTCHLGSLGLGQNVQTSESDITEIVSAPTSVTNSPVMDLDLLIGKGDFDTDFTEYFSS